MPTENVVREARDRVHPYQKHVFVCHWGKTCPTKGSQELVGLLREKLAARGLQDDIRVTKSGCLALCDIGPNMVVYPEGTWCSGVRPGDLDQIVERCLVAGQPVERLQTPGSRTACHGF